MQKIIVVCKSGTVIDVRRETVNGAFSTHQEVEVWDYDTDGRDEEQLETDEDGVKFDRQIW